MKKVLSNVIGPSLLVSFGPILFLRVIIRVKFRLASIVYIIYKTEGKILTAASDFWVTLDASFAGALRPAIDNFAQSSCTTHLWLITHSFGTAQFVDLIRPFASACFNAVSLTRTLAHVLRQAAIFAKRIATEAFTAILNRRIPEAEFVALHKTFVWPWLFYFRVDAVS
jgi:hypothetical protein